MAVAKKIKPTKKPVKAKSKATVKKIIGPTLASFTVSGEAGKAIAVPEAVKMKVSQGLLSQVIRVYNQRRRQGTQSTKTRGEVVGSTRKIYRQKGTGRARHGDIKAPIFVGGGIVFGPKPRDFTDTIPQKMRHKALLALLSDRMTHGKTSVLSDLASVTGKTKDMVKLFTKMGLFGKKLLFVVTPDNEKAVRATRNIEDIEIRPIDSLSAMDVLKSEYIVFTEEALKFIK